MTYDIHITECIRELRDVTLEEAAKAVGRLTPLVTDAATIGMAIRAIRALKSHAPASTPAPTRGQLITDLIWEQLEDRPLGLARAPEERKRDLADAIDAALADEMRSTAPTALTAPTTSGPGTLEAAYRDMAQASSDQIVCAVGLALGRNQTANVADDLQEMLNRANLDRANGLVAAAFSRLHAVLAGKERL